MEITPFRWRCEEWNDKRGKWEEVCLYRSGKTKYGVSRKKQAIRHIHAEIDAGNRARLVDLRTGKIVDC